MCRPQCLLALFALFGFVRSWDLARTNGNQIELYTNETIVQNIGTQNNDLTALAYDAVHNMLLFVDRQNDNGSIFSYHLSTKKYQRLVRKRSSENINGLAFDPVNSLLFFTESFSKSIYSMPLKSGNPEAISAPYGNLWIEMDDKIPMAIAVDSCRGYVYWTNFAKPTIERARFDGSQRQVIVDTDIIMPVALAIDQHTERVYWIDDREGIHYSIESTDLDGTPASRVQLYSGQDHNPKALTVSKDSLYWVDWGFHTVWKLPKNARNNTIHPKEFFEFVEQSVFGIAANYLIQDQIEGVPDCEALSILSKNTSVINESFSVPPEQGLLCVHGEVKDKNKQECKCAVGYTGERCDTSVCHNFCLKGDCSVTDEGNPICSCKEGYSGDRCEIYVCNGYCLNHGECSVNEEHKPECSCQTDFEGVRCETEKIVTTTEAPVTTAPTTKTVQVTVSPTQPEVITETKSVVTPIPDRTVPCNCTANITKLSMYSSEHISDGDFVMPLSCNEGWDSIRDPILMVLGTLCGLLCLGCAVLFTKILQLKKRPRIKKRIIVNKNVTPMTARPDQCEITIENCCNMNICETPCFEPRSTIRPTLLDSKPGKEEKKNLIANMEYPDDY